MELEMAEFHLPQTIENALVLVRERALRRGITLEQSIDQRLGQIQGDERMIPRDGHDVLAGEGGDRGLTLPTQNPGDGGHSSTNLMNPLSHSY
jgi:hypothetical protein